MPLQSPQLLDTCWLSKWFPFPKLYVKKHQIKGRAVWGNWDRVPDSSVGEEATHCVWPLVSRARQARFYLVEQGWHVLLRIKKSQGLEWTLWDSCPPVLSTLTAQNMYSDILAWNKVDQVLRKLLLLPGLSSIFRPCLACHPCWLIPHVTIQKITRKALGPPGRRSCHGASSILCTSGWMTPANHAPFHSLLFITAVNCLLCKRRKITAEWTLHQKPSSIFPLNKVEEE